MDALKSFIAKVANANGPAQIVSYSFWGVLIAGMLWDFCLGCLPQPLLALWGVVSVAVLLTSIWCPKKVTQSLLWADMVISAVVLSIIAMHDPHVTKVMYAVTDSGEFVKHEVSDAFTVIAVAWMTLHGAYLANLLQRQELEFKRMHNEL